MDMSLWILVGIVVVLMVIALWKGRWQLLLSGFKQAGLTFKFMWFRVALGLTLGGLIQVLIPSPVIAEWLGPASGLKGILLGSYIGVITTGGPWVVLPIIASIYSAGAGAGPVIALLVSMNALSLSGLFMLQIPFLGAKIALTRYVIMLIAVPIIGVVGAAVYQLF